MDRSGRHDRRVAVYWPCQSGEDQQLLLWPDQRHLVWHYFLSDSAVCQPAITGVFFAANIYGWYAWSRQTSQNEAELKIRWLPLPKALSWLAVCVVSIGLMTVFINPVFAFLTRVAVMIMQALGLQVVMPELQPDAFPFWDSCMMVLSIVAMILMTRKYVENWLLWVIINVISVVIFALQGVYAMSLEYIILTFIALNGSRMWINSARERGSRALSH